MKPYLPFVFLAVFAVSCGITGEMRRDGVSEAKRDSKTKGSARGLVIETGVASWYGPHFHGKLTANGEIYDMGGPTAAHRTLPFGTVLRVENLDNGKSTVVRINDRGPFAKNRIIDLSRKAAEEIEMVGPGTAPVRLVLLEGDPSTFRTDNLKIATFTVQLASFKTRQQAADFADTVKGSRVEKIELNGEPVYRVYYGIYTERERAREKKVDLLKKGVKGYVKQIQN